MTGVQTCALPISQECDGLHTGLRVAGAAKTFFSKNVTLFKKNKHIKYVSVDDIRFWFLNAGENFGF